MTLPEARRLIEHRGRHRVVSLYMDLDPERFATPPARESEIDSLIDEASRDVEGQDGLEHNERIALREDLERIKSFLLSDDAPYKGARALAVFCSTRDDLFETVQLTRPVPGRVVIDRTPYVEPMIAAAQQLRWLVVLVNMRAARLLAGSPDRLRERARLDDQVHGRHQQGGWSQANYERSVEDEVDRHLRNIAEIVAKRWEREQFDRLALGGPPEIVPRFAELLGQDVRAHEVPERVEVDIGSATEAQVREAVERLVDEDEKRSEREALDRLAAGVGSGARGAAGLEDAVAALNERRVETLLVDEGFDAQGGSCPTCGLLVAGAADRCPADGSELEPVEHMREAIVEAAVAQDAEVIVVRHHPDLGPLGGVGAVLRY
jgi:peptide subunit release factor 1 (eRF1)